MHFSPLMRRRFATFRRNKRGWISLWLFLTLFVLSIFSEFIANDKPIFVFHQGKVFFPIIISYTEIEFGGDFETEADYRDPFLQALIDKDGFALWPLIPYRYDTHITDLALPAPSPPSGRNWLGTDDQARDVTARLLYGFRLSVIFGLLLTFITSILGVLVGLFQGYFGGLVDLIGQRLIELWTSVPQLYLLIIVASLIIPSFWTLLFIMAIFGWTGLVGVVRAEVLRVRNFDYIKAARAMGMSHTRIMMRHTLPNAMVATLTLLPFTAAGSLVILTGLDFLGLGLPPGSPSLGELLSQGKNNLHAPWLGISGFLVTATMLTLMVFVGEAVREAFDPRKNVMLEK